MFIHFSMLVKNSDKTREIRITTLDKLVIFEIPTMHRDKYRLTRTSVPTINIVNIANNYTD